MNKPRPVLIMNGVLAGLGVVLGGAALGDYLDLKLVGLLLLIHSGASVTWALITQQSVTPNPLVTAFRPDPDSLASVAGDGSQILTGRPVDVTSIPGPPGGAAGDGV